MLPAKDVHDALAIGVAVSATFGAWRRSRGTALAVVLGCEIASNSSLAWLKQPFLTARWAALLTLAILILPEFRRVPRRVLLRVGLLAILPALAVLSALWSVEPHLTLERAATFAVMLSMVAAYGVSWGVDPAELDDFVDSAAVLSVVVFVVSLAVAAIDSRGLLNGQLRGIFENPNGLGIFLGLTYPFVAAALDRRGIVRMQIVVIAAYGAVAVAAQSRSGILALALVVIGFELARRRFIWGSVAAAASVVLVAVALVAAHGSQTATSSTTPTKSGGVLSVGAPAASVSLPHGQSFVSRLTGARSEGWGAALKLIESKPVEGYGFGTGDRLFSLYSDRVHFEYFEGANPNEAYLQLVLELGVVIGGIVLLPLLGAAVLGARLLAAGKNLSGMACGLTMIAGLVVGLVESVFTSAGAPWAPLIWVAGAGCVAATLVGADGRSSVRIPWQPSRRFVPSRRVIGAVLGATGVAAVGWVLFRPQPPAPLTLKQSLNLVAKREPCARNGCHISGFVKLKPGLFWVKLSGQPNVCLIVEPADVTRTARSNREGVASSTCRTLPLATAHMLAVGVPAATFPPYFVLPVNDPTGFEPALIRAIVARLGIGLINWGGASRPQPTSKTDIVIHQTVDAWNEPTSFLPYLPLWQELVALRGTPEARTRTLAAAARLRLGISDAYGAAAVKHFIHPRTAVLRFASDDQAVAALRSGRVDAIVIYRQNAVAIVKRFPQLVHVGLLPPDRFIGMRFRAGSLLEPLFAARLRRLESSGELLRLRTETLGPLPALRSLL